MWLNRQRFEEEFIYFYFQEFKVINNNTESKLFENIFSVDKPTKEAWCSSSTNKLLTSEALTRWDFN